MEVRFEFKGAKELARALDGLGYEIASRAAKQAVRAGGQVIADEAKRLVPIRSGELGASITVQPDKDAADQYGAGVLIGFFKPTSSRAHLTEFGTAHSAAKPFMRPAMDAKADEALREMGRVLSRGITREAKRLAKR